MLQEKEVGDVIIVSRLLGDIRTDYLILLCTCVRDNADFLEGWRASSLAQSLDTVMFLEELTSLTEILSAEGATDKKLVDLDTSRDLDDTFSYLLTALLL